MHDPKGLIALCLRPTTLLNIATHGARYYEDFHYDEADDDHMLAGTFRNLDWKTLLSGSLP